MSYLWLLLFFQIFFIAVFLFHPFFICIGLLLYTYTTLILIMCPTSHWLIYIILLIYLGGILILFIYISSLIPNIMNIMNFFLFLMMMFFLYPMLMFFFLKTLNTVILSPEMSGLSTFMLSFSCYPYFIFFCFFSLFQILILSVLFFWQKSIPLRIM